MGTVTIEDTTICRTTDGQTFDRLHKAKAHQAELDIRQMLAECDYRGAEQDLIMQAFHRVGIYVPAQLWDELMG
jgi:hypothetical protein